jgi:hypothetical protein
MAVVYFMAVYILPGLVDSSDGQAPRNAHARQSGQCTEPLQVRIKHGEHRGHPWSVIAGIENDHDCSAWFLKVKFLPQNRTSGSWEGGWEIPSGGHLPDSATISAQDEATGGDRVISGVVGWKVQTIVFITKSGDRFAVHPKAPEATLRKRFGWLNNLRYFLRFYPVGDPVKVARLLDSRGETIGNFPCRLGEIEGKMSL